MQSEIISKIRNGDFKTLEKLCVSLLGKTLSVIRKLGGTREESEDALQEALIVFWENLNFKPEFNLTVMPETWIIAVAKNKWLEYKRRDRNRSDLPDNQEIADDSFPELENILNCEQQDSWNLAWQKLSNRCQQLISGFYYERQSMEQISRQQKLTSADSAKTLLSRCRKNFRDLLIKFGFTGENYEL